MVRYKVLISIILLVLPISFLSAQNMSRYDVIGWNYIGAFGYPDIPNIGMIIEEGPNSLDSVMRINSCGWTTKNGSNEWVLQTDFEKSLTQEYPWPDSVLIDINITNIESNVYYLGMLISLEDTTGDGIIGYASHSIPIISGWQTIRFWVGHGGLNGDEHVCGIGIHITPSSMDSGYIGVELQVNNMRFIYNNGDTILVDPFQYIWDPTAVEPIQGLIPSGFVLEQNYPNPFNPNTKIRYELPEFSSVKLTVYNLLGEEIAKLVNSEQPAGVYEASFDGTNLASGTYIYVLQTGTSRLERKMVLLK